MVVSKAKIARLYGDFARGPGGLLTYSPVNRDLAEDLVQESFLKLLGRLEHLRSADSLQAYLNRTVVNLANKHWRGSRLERQHAERERMTLGTSCERAR